MAGCALAIEEGVKTVQKDKENDGRNNVSHIQPHPGRNLQTLAFVGFRHKGLPAPAVTADTEQRENQTAQRKQNIVYGEILKVHNAQTQDFYIIFSSSVICASLNALIRGVDALVEF